MIALPSCTRPFGLGAAGGRPRRSPSGVVDGDEPRIPLAVQSAGKNRIALADDHVAPATL